MSFRLFDVLAAVACFLIIVTVIVAFIAGLLP